MAIHTSTVHINTSIQKVFDSLTKPELIKRWQFGRIVTTDWKPGSEIKFRIEQGGKITEQWGTVLEMKPNELIKYNLFTPRPDLEDKIENYCVTSYVLVNENGQTKVELIQEDNRPDGFVPVNLNPVLLALKNSVESN